jgi:hypothetical protein
MRATLLAFALTCALAAPAAAQQLTVAFHDGLVTIDATSVPVRTILNEWSKQGGTKVVGVERVTGAPLTIKLVDVPEAKALEVVLRSVAGYLAAPRSAGTGPSMYDRILVMATSSAPAPSAATRPTVPQPNPAFNGTQRFVPPQRQLPDDDEATEDDPTPPNPPVFTFPGAPGAGGQPAFPNMNGQNFPQQMQPMIINPATGAAQPQINPAPGGYPSAVPFGSSTPGVITAPPSQPGQRPPGGRQQQ